MNETTAVEAQRNFVAELAEAERRATDAEIAERLAFAAVKKEESIITGAERDLFNEVGVREVNQRIITEAKSKLTKNRANLSKATTEAEKEKTAAAHVRFDIRNHPLMTAAAARQKDLCEKAAELARRAWHETPLLKFDPIRRDMEKLIDAEDALVARENEALKAAGLPVLSARIRSASMNVLPSFVWDRALGEIANDAAVARHRLIEF